MGSQRSNSKYEVSCSFVCGDEIWDKREVFAIWVAIKTKQMSDPVVVFTLLKYVELRLLLNMDTVSEEFDSLTNAFFLVELLYFQI